MENLFLLILVREGKKWKLDERNIFNLEKDWKFIGLKNRKREEGKVWKIVLNFPRHQKSIIPCDDGVSAPPRIRPLVGRGSCCFAPAYWDTINWLKGKKKAENMKRWTFNIRRNEIKTWKLFVVEYFLKFLSIISLLICVRCYEENDPAKFVLNNNLLDKNSWTVTCQWSGKFHVIFHAPLTDAHTVKISII